VFHHISTNGIVVDHERWEWRKREAAQAVSKRYLTLREASEHFAIPEEEIVGSCSATAH
jgi:hypothetical protein